MSLVSFTEAVKITRWERLHYILFRYYPQSVVDKRMHALALDEALIKARFERDRLLREF